MAGHCKTNYFTGWTTSRCSVELPTADQKPRPSQKIGGGGGRMKNVVFRPGLFRSQTEKGLINAIASIPRRDAAKLKPYRALSNDGIMQFLMNCKNQRVCFDCRMELFHRLEIGDAVFAFGGYTRVKKVYKNGKHIMVENCEQKACVDDVVFLLK